MKQFIINVYEADDDACQAPFMAIFKDDDDSEKGYGQTMAEAVSELIRNISYE